MKSGQIIIGFCLIFLMQVFLAKVTAGYPTESQSGKANPAPGGNSKVELTQPISAHPILPDQILKDIRQIEYNEIKYDEESPNYYGFIRGNIPILISAPHGAMHYRSRENRWKGEDEYTASLAIELGQLTGAYVLYVKNKTREDPNNDFTSEYKTALAKAVKQYGIRFVLDLHGSDESRPYKVDIGTIRNGKSCSCPTFRGTIQKVFSDFESKVFNQRFCANDPGTITYFVRNELGIEAAQAEINAKYRIVERKPDSCKAKAGIEPHFKADPKDVVALVATLQRLILALDERIGKRGPELSAR